MLLLPFEGLIAEEGRNHESYGAEDRTDHGTSY